MKHFGDGRDWFFDKRFGLFLHFGLYAIEGWHEQDQMRRRISRDEYSKLVDRFNPSRFAPDTILDLAQSAGLEYACLTAKHHDGFCLWDTACTEFNVMRSPYGRDIVKQFADACHRRDFPLGLYYSVVDWHHRNYPNQGRHHELAAPERDDKPDWDKYMEFVKKQVRELCAQYGPIHHFFWDMNVPQFRDPSVNAMLRSLQPGMVINDRGFDEGDFETPEREYRKAETDGVLRFTRPTEACNSVGVQSWGYRQDEDYYSARYLIESIDSIMARGGNYLLNVGPDADGAIAEPSADILREIGAWYTKVREAFDAEPANEMIDAKDILLTRRDNSLYVHLPRPQAAGVVLKPLAQCPSRALLLNTGERLCVAIELLPVFWESGQKYLRVKGIPVNELTAETLVIRLDFDLPI